MSHLIRLLFTGFFITLLLVGGSLIPHFPDEFGTAITSVFSYVLKLDTWLPVRLAIQLFSVVVIVDSVIYGWRFVKWFKAFILGESKT